VAVCASNKRRLHYYICCSPKCGNEVIHKVHDTRDCCVCAKNPVMGDELKSTKGVQVWSRHVDAQDIDIVFLTCSEKCLEATKTDRWLPDPPKQPSKYSSDWGSGRGEDQWRGGRAKDQWRPSPIGAERHLDEEKPERKGWVKREERKPAESDSLQLRREMEFLSLSQSTDERGEAPPFRFPRGGPPPAERRGGFSMKRESEERWRTTTREERWAREERWRSDRRSDRRRKSVCDHCSYTFMGTPVGCYTCRGIFCSHACADAHAKQH